MQKAKRHFHTKITYFCIVIYFLVNYNQQKMILEITHQYKILLHHIERLIDISGYRNDYIAKKMKLKASNFSAKKHRSSWTVDEVEKLLSIIDNEEVENYFMLQLMRSKKQEETITLKEFKKEMGWK